MEDYLLEYAHKNAYVLGKNGCRGLFAGIIEEEGGRVDVLN